jgi:hypothetical protein
MCSPASRTVQTTVDQTLIVQRFHRDRGGVVRWLHFYEPGHDAVATAILAMARLAVVPVQSTSGFGLTHQAVFRGTQKA